jgi:hypothetical protein
MVANPLPVCSVSTTTSGTGYGKQKSVLFVLHNKREAFLSFHLLPASTINLHFLRTHISHRSRLSMTMVPMIGRSSVWVASSASFWTHGLGFPVPSKSTRANTLRPEGPPYLLLLRSLQSYLIYYISLSKYSYV